MCDSNVDDKVLHDEEKYDKIKCVRETVQLKVIKQLMYSNASEGLHTIHT